MTSLEGLFKKPNLPSSKRKSDLNHDAASAYKSARFNGKGDANGGRHTSIEDVDDEDDVEAGPELPPDLEDPADDADGRFFGGGINKNTTQVLDYLDEKDGEEQKDEKFDTAWLRKTALSFEKKISKNAELRAKYEDQPQKFMTSEADLDAGIKSLSSLSEHAELYEEFSNIGCAASLVSLLSHENTDIAIDAIEILNELTDEDVDAEQSQWDVLVDSLLEADLLRLCYENLQRMDEKLEADRAGIYHILGTIENMISRPSIVDLLCKETKILHWLSMRVSAKESPVSQNKQYAAEILECLLQASLEARKMFIENDGIDLCLQLISPYRRKDPLKGTEEEELAENLFACLTCCVDQEAAKEKFVAAEGLELCIIMLKDGKMSKPRALRLIDHALGGPLGGEAATKFVEVGGLKSVFSLLSKKPDRETLEHILGILSSLLRLLPANSNPRIRLLAKFEEHEWRAIHEIIRQRQKVTPRVEAADAVIKAEKQTVEDEDLIEKESEWLSRRLDAGLYVLQTMDVILAWLVAEMNPTRSLIERSLTEDGHSIDSIKSGLKEQLRTMDEKSNTEDPELTDMISTLVDCI